MEQLIPLSIGLGSAKNVAAAMTDSNRAARLGAAWFLAGGNRVRSVFVPGGWTATLCRAPSPTRSEVVPRHARGKSVQRTVTAGFSCRSQTKRKSEGGTRNTNLACRAPAGRDRTGVPKRRRSRRPVPPPPRSCRTGPMARIHHGRCAPGDAHRWSARGRKDDDSFPPARAKLEDRNRATPLGPAQPLPAPP